MRDKNYISGDYKLKRTHQSIMQKQLQSLTEQEKDVITKMSGALSQKINFPIGNEYNLSKYKKEICLVDKALSKGKIPYDMTVIRKTVPQFMLNKKIYRDIDVLNLKGTIMSNKIFTFTSLIDFDYPLRNVIINMKVPKGFGNVLYIKDLAYDNSKHQEELLFGRGLVYYIKDVVKKDNLFIMTARRLVMKDKEWFDMSEEEQEEFYKKHNIGGGFREPCIGYSKQLSEEDLNEETYKRLQKIKEEEKKSN